MRIEPTPECRRLVRALGDTTKTRDEHQAAREVFAAYITPFIDAWVNEEFAKRAATWNRRLTPAPNSASLSP